MPKKKQKQKQKPAQKQKQKQKQQVKQIVKVSVGEMRRKEKQLPEPMNPLLRQAPINVSLSTQSYQPSQPSYINEYNALLRQLTEERIARQRAAPPLQANTSPLTINQQRNELLGRVESQLKQATPLAKEIKTPSEDFSNILENVVDDETYDDPLSNENMFVNSSRLSQNLAPRLFVNEYFDYNDINKYDDEDETQQNALEKEVIEQKRKPNESISIIAEPAIEEGEEEYVLPKEDVLPKKRKENIEDKRIKTYDDYKNYINKVNRNFNLEIPILPFNSLNSLNKINKERNIIRQKVKEIQQNK